MATKSKKKEEFSFSEIDFTAAATRAAGLATGGIGAAVVNNLILENVLPKMLADPEKADQALMLSNAGTAVVGTLLPEFVEGDFMKSVGDGMVAIASVNLAQKFIPTEWKEKLGIAGVGMNAIDQAAQSGKAIAGRGYADWYNAGAVQDQQVLAGLGGVQEEDSHTGVIGRTIY